MDSEVIKISENHKSFSDKSVNVVLLSFGLSREDMGQAADTLIDESLCGVRAYCKRENPENCFHAEVEYDEQFHRDDKVRKLNHTDNFVIPSPGTAHACWRLLNEYIERRQPHQEAAFLIRWGPLKFNAIELNTLKSLGKELQKIKVDTKLEEEFLMNGKNHHIPNGMTQLDEEDPDISRAIQMILKSKLTLKQNTPLCTIKRTIEDYANPDNEQIFNFSHPSRQFFDEDLHFVAEVLNHQSDAKDVFIIFTPDLVDRAEYADYVAKKGCKAAETIHVVVNINPAKGLVNTTEQNGHWVYVSIRSKNVIIFGDPMGSRAVPTNIRTVLDPIYFEKFGENMPTDLDIMNCSRQPNFPVQTCSTICGLVAAMLCICSYHDDLFKEIFFSQKENENLEMIKKPSFYSSQIRLRFLKVAMSRNHCVESFIPAKIEFTYKEGDDQLFPSRKTKSTANRAWSSLKSKSRTSLKSQTRASVVKSKPSAKAASKSPPVVPASRPSPVPAPRPSPVPASMPSPVPAPMPSSVPASNPSPVTILIPSPVPKESAPESRTSASLTNLPTAIGANVPNATSASSSSTARGPSPSSVLVSGPSTVSLIDVSKQLVEHGYTGEKVFESAKGYPNIDGFLWKALPGYKVKGPRIFSCIEADCKAEKNIFKTKHELRKKLNRKNPNHPITVKYTRNHSCKSKPKSENVSVSSYYLALYPKKEAIDSDIIEDDIINTNSESINLERNENERASTSTSGPNRVEQSEGEPNATNEDQNTDSPVSLTEQQFAEIPDLCDDSNDPNDNSLTDSITDQVLQAWSPSNTQEGSAEIEKGTTHFQLDKEGNRNESENQFQYSEASLLNCYLCSFVTKCKEEYSDHTLLSHGKRCSKCDYGTTTDDLLKKHKQLPHDKCCIVCDYSTTTDEMLKYHDIQRHRPQTIMENQPITDEEQQHSMEQLGTVYDILTRSNSRKRRVDENDSLQFKNLKKVRECEASSEPMCEAADDGGTNDQEEEASLPDCSQKQSKAVEDTQDTHGSSDDSTENGQTRVQTKHVEKFDNSFDNNDGNVAFVIKSYSLSKKPTSDRKIYNWGCSQSQRGKTTLYPCSGYFACDNCEEKSSTHGSCTTCKVQLQLRECQARKYIYFCDNSCRREAYKECCESESQKKLVILYLGKHTCIPVKRNTEKNKSYKFKEVETEEDILENINILVEHESPDFAIEKVEKPPSGIDGNHYYLLDNKENLELKEMIRDGRKWQTFTQTTNKAFANIFGETNIKKVRKYKCSDQFFCYNQKCPFKKRFEIMNQVNWITEEDGIRKCISCTDRMEMIKCDAEKFTAKSDDKRFILIKHVGKHKCLHKTLLETRILEEIEEFFCTNPTATRSEAILHHLISKINFGSTQDVIDLVSVSLNIWELNNLKQKGLKRLNPHGSKLEAIKHLKSKLNDIGNPFNIVLKIFEDVYICDICEFISEKSEHEDCVKFCANCSMAPMEHVGPSVFISSRDSLDTLRELRSNGSLATEACCLDHQPSRLRAFNTFAAYCYDLDLRRMCPLFAAVMINEKELSVYHCLDVVDRCLEEEFGTGEVFDPNLIIADEATAIKNAVSRKLGVEKIEKQYGTCQLHYMMSILQHSSFVIGNKKEIWQYMKLSEQLMKAETPELYDLFKKELLEFISKTEQRHSHLFNWLEFYDSRKTGWSKAFRNPELPKTNKGESGNAHYSAVTHLTGLPLDLGVKAIIAEMHVYAGCKRGIKTGQYKGGNGPTRATMDEKLTTEIFERISKAPLTHRDTATFMNDILDKIGLKEKTVDEAPLEGITDEESSEVERPVEKSRSVFETHLYLAKQLESRAKARIESPKFINGPHKAPKKVGKRKIQFSDTLDDVTSDNQNKKKKSQTKQDGKSLNEKILQTLSDGFDIKTVDNGVYQLTIKQDPDRCYTVNLQHTPTCTCPEFKRISNLRKKDPNTELCKHIPVMCLCLGFTYSCSVTRRYSYSATERTLVNLKIATFAHTTVNIEDIKETFENEMNAKSEKQQTLLPFLDTKKYFGQYKSYEEAKLFIDERRERYPCEWFGLVYEEKRYVCTSPYHSTVETKRLRLNLSHGRPLVFLVHFTRIFFNKNTGRWCARNEKKYFHMNVSCVSNFGRDLSNSSNLKPPFDIDITRMSADNRAFVKKTFPSYTFIEDE